MFGDMNAPDGYVQLRQRKVFLSICTAELGDEVLHGFAGVLYPIESFGGLVADVLGHEDLGQGVHTDRLQHSLKLCLSLLPFFGLLRLLPEHGQGVLELALHRVAAPTGLLILIRG